MYEDIHGLCQKYDTFHFSATTLQSQSYFLWFPRLGVLLPVGTKGKCCIPLSSAYGRSSYDFSVRLFLINIILRPPEQKEKIRAIKHLPWTRAIPISDGNIKMRSTGVASVFYSSAKFSTFWRVNTEFTQMCFQSFFGLWLPLHNLKQIYCGGSKYRNRVGWWRGSLSKH